MQRDIVHLDLDSFFVSVERLENSSLCGKPVIVGGVGNRGVVSSCSYEARRYGVHSAMPITMARILCKEAIVIRGDMEKYSRYSHIVTQIVEGQAPLYEKASIDEHYIDITGMDTFYGSLKWTKELRKKIITETGLPISFGLSVNKTVAKIATGESKPNGELCVPLEKVNLFLDPLSIAKIPMVGVKTFSLLRSMGIAAIGMLRSIPMAVIKETMGEHGVCLWKKANGIDNTPVEAYKEKKSISTEHTFDTDTADIRLLHTMLIKMTEQLAYELRTQHKLTSCVTVKIRYSDFDTHTIQKRIAYTSFDHLLIQTAKELFTRLYNRRLLIRLIGVRLSHLIGGTQQLSLFDDTSRMSRLYAAMDTIRHRFGDNAVGRMFVGKRRGQ